MNPEPHLVVSMDVTWDQKQTILYFWVTHPPVIGAIGHHPFPLPCTSAKSTLTHRAAGSRSLSCRRLHVVRTQVKTETLV